MNEAESFVALFSCTAQTAETATHLCTEKAGLETKGLPWLSRS